MSTFLYIVLGAVLGVVLTPIVLWFAFKLFVRLFLKKLIKAFAGAAAGVPTFRLEIEREPDPEWHNAKLIERLTDELEKRGFRQAGDYLVVSGAAVSSRGFAHPESGLYAIVYDWDPDLLPGMGVVVDIAADSSDGRHFTVSNAPETGLDQPDWSEKATLDIDITNARVAIDALLKRTQELIAGAELLPVTPEGFTVAFKKAYAREMDWQIERGGLQRDEIIRNALTMNKDLAEDDESLDALVEATQTQWKEAIADFISEETRERFLRHVTKMSAGEWEDTRDRVFVVHDRSQAETLIEELVDTLVDYEDDEDDEDDDNAYDRRRDEATAKFTPLFDGATPRQGFEAAQEAMPKKRRYKRLARIKSPWPADVYLGPRETE